jgi:hypothetical protein
MRLAFWQARPATSKLRGEGGHNSIQAESRPRKSALKYFVDERIDKQPKRAK